VKLGQLPLQRSVFHLVEEKEWPWTELHARLSTLVVVVSIVAAVGADDCGRAEGESKT
jgi:hypothetical protein